MMKPVERFFTKTSAYRSVVRDIKSGTLSHSYLLVCSDEIWLREYARALAKVIMCEKGDFCGECRACRLIDRESFVDCEFYPKEGEKITADGINEIVAEKCHVRPLEADKRMFVIIGAEKMNTPAQNKILKTLEEPPKNVIIILAAEREYTLLPTVKSRVKRLEIPLFSMGEIYKEFEGRYADKDRLKRAALLCDGKPGRVEQLYMDESVSQLVDECVNILFEMKKSPDIAQHSAKLIKKSREEFSEFLNTMRMVLRDLLFIKEGLEASVINSDKAYKLRQIADRYDEGALLATDDVLTRVIQANEGYANQTMLVDKLLFTLLEENYKWQKL